MAQGGHVHEIGGAVALAEEHCDECAWYHGTWPLWRSIGLGSTPEGHAPFYREAARGVPPGARVVVTGAADAAMPALVREVFESPDVTLVDRCRTPLLLARGARTVQADVLAFAPEVPFDVACTHSFLGNFDFEERRALAATWYRLLRPGGRLVTVNRLRPGLEGPIGFTEAERVAFVAAVRERAPDPAWVGLAEEYTRRARTWPVRSAAEIEALLAGAGFSVSIRTERLVRPGPGGPTAPGDATYALVVATRSPIA